MLKHMMVWLALVASTITIAGHAQQPNATWTELQRGDLSVPGREGITMTIVIPPGGQSARHSHPGEDFGYLLAGTVVLEFDDGERKTLAAGDAYLIRRGRVHHARNIGRTPARFLDTYVIEKGQPVVTPAPAR
jgi:quercetin dioxygenase-like cupin family protein